MKIWNSSEALWFLLYKPYSPQKPGRRSWWQACSCWWKHALVFCLPLAGRFCLVSSCTLHLTCWLHPQPSTSWCRIIIYTYIYIILSPKWWDFFKSMSVKCYPPPKKKMKKPSIFPEQSCSPMLSRPTDPMRSIGTLVLGNLLQDFIVDDSQNLEDRNWIWNRYGTAYRVRVLNEWFIFWCWGGHKKREYGGEKDNNCWNQVGNFQRNRCKK